MKQLMKKVENLNGYDRVQRFMARAYFQSMLPYLVMGVLLVVAIVAVGREIEHHVHAIESWIGNLGSWSELAFIGLYILTTSFLLPEAVLAIIAGALFGLRWGLVVVFIGSMLAAALQFFISRHLLRDRVRRALARRPALAAIQRAVSRDAIRLQVLLRLTPVNPATISYLLGAAGVRFSGFLLTCLALAPITFIEVYFGRTCKHLARMTGGSARTVFLHDLVIIGSLAVCFVMVVFIARMARKALLEAVSETDDREQPNQTSLR